MPSGSLNGSTVSPKRFSGASCGTPFSTKRWVQKPIDSFGTRNAVSCAWPIPARPGATWAQGKKVRMVPGRPVSSPK